MMNFLLSSVFLLLPLGQDPAPEKPLDKAPASETKPGRAYELMVGDLAPQISIETWVKGEAVPSELAKGEVYLVDFWATWCGPCLRSMPHLSKLQEKHEKDGFTVLSVTTEDARGNTLEAVRSKVEGKKEQMRFRVAWDRNRKTYEAWMNAAGRNTIPSAFLVDREGRIAFIGNPAKIDKTLEEVLAGKFDLAAATRAYAKEAAQTQEKREQAAHAKGLVARVSNAQKRRDWPAVLAGYDELIGLGGRYQDYVVHRFSTLLIRMQDPAQAYSYALEASGGVVKEREEILCKMARLILDSPGVVERDAGVALILAAQADELTGRKNAHNAETLARACHLLGDLEGAVQAARRAVEHSPKAKVALYKNMLRRFEDQLAKGAR
ncbi:MAG: TlpA disulfide reductase family protein [Planctomycetota bacterium]